MESAKRRRDASTCVVFPQDRGSLIHLVESIGLIDFTHARTNKARSFDSFDEAMGRRRPRRAVRRVHLHGGSSVSGRVDGSTGQPSQTRLRTRAFGDAASLRRCRSRALEPLVRLPRRSCDRSSTPVPRQARSTSGGRIPTRSAVPIGTSPAPSQIGHVASPKQKGHRFPLLSFSPRHMHVPLPQQS